MEAEVHLRRDTETLDVLAWALSRAGRLGEAQQAMQEALHTGVHDARLFYRAATIERSLGHDMQVKRFIELMRQTDPTFDERARLVMGVGSRGEAAAGTAHRPVCERVWSAAPGLASWT